MNWLYDTFYDVFEFLNPWTRSRQIYEQGRQGWRQLLKNVSPEARLLLMTNFFWTIPLALTEPFKSLYLTKLGLDAFHLGEISGLDMGLRSAGVLLGGWLGLRFGHKRTVLWGDFLSWVVSSAVLALATHPAHIIFWACLMATNAVVSAPFQHIFLKATPQEARTAAYGFMNFSGVLPGVLLPFAASLLLHYFDFVTTMRALLGFQAVMMATGIIMRSKHLPEEPAEAPAKREALGDRVGGIVSSILNSPGAIRILAFWIIANIAGNYWRVYFSLFAVQKMGWPEANIGYYFQIGAVAFVISSLFWLPRLKSETLKRDLFLANLASLLPPLMLFAGPGWTGILVLNICGGLFAAINAALTGAIMASILPQNELALSFSLCIALMQLLLGASFPAAGALFRDNMMAFAWSSVVLNIAQAALAFSLWWPNKNPPPVTEGG